MNTLVCCLTYGNRPLDIIYNNLEQSGFPFNVKFINVEGISNALNEGIYTFKEGNYEAITFLANDIEEPKDWLLKKLIALKNYDNAGIIGSPIDHKRYAIQNEHTISNWIIKKEVIDKVGLFNESMFPYGPIDLDYCERVWIAGFKTYYAMDYLATHIGSHAEGNEYGYNKQEMVNKYWGDYMNNIKEYKNGSKSIKI
ncbi:glycosyltransferase family 2 protein [bacterium]|nr:glycosyltransferase family 2 protein [bacterium]